MDGRVVLQQSLQAGLDLRTKISSNNVDKSEYKSTVKKVNIYLHITHSTWCDYLCISYTFNFMFWVIVVVVVVYRNEQLKLSFLPFHLFSELYRYSFSKFQPMLLHSVKSWNTVMDSDLRSNCTPQRWCFLSMLTRTLPCNFQQTMKRKKANASRNFGRMFYQKLIWLKKLLSQYLFLNQFLHFFACFREIISLYSL